MWSYSPCCGSRFQCLVLELVTLFLTAPLKSLGSRPCQHSVPASDFPDCAEVLESVLDEWRMG